MHAGERLRRRGVDRRIRAWACGLRRTAACSMPGQPRSSTYGAPGTQLGSSLRGRSAPTHAVRVLGGGAHDCAPRAGRAPRRRRCAGSRCTAEVARQRVPDLGLARVRRCARAARPWRHEQARACRTRTAGLRVEKACCTGAARRRRASPRRWGPPRRRPARRTSGTSARCAVDEHGARAADAVLAADVRAGEAEVVAQEVDEQRARLDADVVLDAVDGQLDDGEVGVVSMSAALGAADGLGPVRAARPPGRGCGAMRATRARRPGCGSRSARRSSASAAIARPRAPGDGGLLGPLGAHGGGPRPAGRSAARRSGRPRPSSTTAHRARQPPAARPARDLVERRAAAGAGTAEPQRGDQLVRPARRGAEPGEERGPPRGRVRRRGDR